MVSVVISLAQLWTSDGSLGSLQLHAMIPCRSPGDLSCPFSFLIGNDTFLSTPWGVVFTRMYSFGFGDWVCGCGMLNGDCMECGDRRSSGEFVRLSL